MNEVYYFADCGYYKEEMKGESITIKNRPVGIAYQGGGWYATDIKTGLSLNAEGKADTKADAIEQAKKYVEFFNNIPEEKLAAREESLHLLPPFQEDVVFKASKTITYKGMINRKPFEVNVKFNGTIPTITLEDSQYFTESECNLIIDEIERSMA